MNKPALLHTPINPYVIVYDVDAAILFYQKAFGFSLLETGPTEDGSSGHAEMLFEGQLIMFGKAGAWDITALPPHKSGVECPVTLCLTVPEVDAFYEHAIQNGAQSISAPEDAFWGARMCRLGDIDGYIWCIYKMKA